MVDGRDAPGDADAEEDVDAVGAGDVSDGGVCVPVLNGGHLTGERVWRAGSTVTDSVTHQGGCESYKYAVHITLMGNFNYRAHITRKLNVVHR